MEASKLQLSDHSWRYRTHTLTPYHDPSHVLFSFYKFSSSLHAYASLSSCFSSPLLLRLLQHMRGVPSSSPVAATASLLWRVQIFHHPTWTHLGRPSASLSVLPCSWSLSSPWAVFSPAVTTGTSSDHSVALPPATLIPRITSSLRPPNLSFFTR